MSFINWCVMLIPLIGILGLAVYSRKYVRGVADYLAAGRVAGRYVISVGDLSSMLGVITIIAMVEQQYQCGFALNFWNNIIIPISLVTSLTGYCLYRFRETKAMSMGQFLEHAGEQRGQREFGKQRGISLFGRGAPAEGKPRQRKQIMPYRACQPNQQHGRHGDDQCARKIAF